MQFVKSLLLACTALALAPISANAADWTTYAANASRQGYNGAETAITPATVGQLQLAWSRGFAAISLAQPLYLHSVTTPNGTHSEVFEATTNGQVVAMNALRGIIDWTVQLPTSQAVAGSCFPSGLGVRGTPTIDTNAGLIYAVDGTGAVHALNIGTGAEAAGFPVQVVDPANVALGASNHTAITQVGTTLFITTSGAPGCEPGSPLHGGVYAFNLTTLTVTQSYFPVTQAKGGGGIWGPGGAMIDPVTQNLFIGTGNAYGQPDDTPLGESVISLDENLNLLGSHSPGNAYFTKAGDFDFGSTPTPIDVPNCPPLLAVMSKTGNLFVYQRQNLGAGPVQVINMIGAAGKIDAAFIGMASYDPTQQLLFVNNPLSSPGGLYTNGAIALAAPSSPACNTAPQQLQTAWQTTFGANVFNARSRSTDPTVAGGLVWVVTGLDSTVMALNEATGQPVWSSAALRGPITLPVTVADGLVFAQDGKRLYTWSLQ